MAISQQPLFRSSVGLPVVAPQSVFVSLQPAGWGFSNLRIGMPEKAAGEGVQWNFRQ